MKINICGLEYIVKTGQLPDGEIGGCDPNSRIITVSDSVSHDVYESTVLHECIHAGFSASGLEHLISEEMQESITCMVEHTLHNAGYRLMGENDGRWSDR